MANRRLQEKGLPRICADERRSARTFLSFSDLLRSALICGKEFPLFFPSSICHLPSAYNEPVPESQQTIQVTSDQAGRRLDQFLVSQLPDVSRARVQELIAGGHVLVNGAAAKASLKLKGTEEIEITTASARPPLRAIAEDIPLDVVYEDDDLAIVTKPAGM